MLDRVRHCDDAALAESPFGAAVRYALRRADAPPDYELRPEELALLPERAVAKRRKEFRLGRTAAHHALRGLLPGPPGPILRRESREPVWPAGVVGAITHAGEIGAAAVAWQGDHAGLGLDIEERHRDVGLDVVRMICREPEARWVREVAAQAELRLKMVFSAKESIFKAFYPREQIWLGFEDAELQWCEDRRAFAATLLKAAGGRYPVGYVLTVECCLSEHYLMTWTALPP
ncbi:MAG: 4'-phosphopantetheinyl transferase superfamily protein [Planctomycetota bacterium]